MPAIESGAQPFVASGEASKSRQPGEGSYHNTTARQEDKSSFRFCMLHNSGWIDSASACVDADSPV